LTDPDVIVIGAGSSGCALVHRLSRDPSIRVLLLEAGVSGEADPNILTPGRWVSLMGSSYDWNYATEPEPGLCGRRSAVPRGKAHGGSSAINAMVHLRGSRSCYDGWHACGNPGWSDEDLQPFFQHDGLLAIVRGDDPHAGHLAFMRAASELGFEPEFFPKNILKGRRHSAAVAFLEPARKRSNVEVRSSAQATRLLIERGRAVGVEYLCNARVEQVRAQREVVVCAGAIDSPKLLMLSGVGAADDVRAHGISVVSDLPGVGRNLQDHLKLSVRWTGKTRLPGSTVTAGLFTSSSIDEHDLQLIVGRGLDQPDDFVTITVSHVKPGSRGAIGLRTADALDAPIIRMNYLTDSHDVTALLDGVALVRRIGGSPAFDPLRGDEIEPGAAHQDLVRFIREKADSIYHAAGTCRMGPASDRDAVVDSQLRVHGIEGLRVADASIMPTIVNAPTHAACVMIGEKCAAMIAA
jgi:choline dehydrogenase